ncbi:MAG: hypothetical protein HZC37_01410 [Burkholderiales bacterium]|nr:hypothetical protein [Burkholderiales bacterium]
MSIPLGASAAWLGSLVLVTTIAAAGLAWRECVLLAAAAVAAYRLFLWRMDVAAPMDGWRAALRCLVAGLFGMVAALTLGAAVASGVAGLWSMSHEHTTLSLTVMVAAGGLITAVQLDNARRWSEALLWTLLVFGAAAGFRGAEAGYLLLPCLIVAAVTVWLARASWALARDSAGQCLRSSQRM